MEVEVEKKIITAKDLRLGDTMYQASNNGAVIQLLVSSLVMSGTNISVNGFVATPNDRLLNGINTYFMKEDAENHFVIAQESKVKMLAEDLIKREKTLEIEVNKLDEYRAKALLK